MKSLSLNEIAAMQFKRKVDVDLSTLNLDIQMFNVVTALDGDRDIKTIAKEDGYDLKELHQKIVRLHQLGVVEMVNIKGRYLSEKMKDLLALQLSEAVGPISNLLIEDVAAEMGFEIQRFPVQKFRALIDRLGERIYDKEQADKFLNDMASFQDAGK